MERLGILLKLSAFITIHFQVKAKSFSKKCVSLQAVFTINVYCVCTQAFLLKIQKISKLEGHQLIIQSQQLMGNFWTHT